MPGWTPLMHSFVFALFSKIFSSIAPSFRNGTKNHSVCWWFPIFSFFFWSFVLVLTPCDSFHLILYCLLFVAIKYIVHCSGFPEKFRKIEVICETCNTRKTPNETVHSLDNGCKRVLIYSKFHVNLHWSVLRVMHNIWLDAVIYSL